MLLFSNDSNLYKEVNTVDVSIIIVNYNTCEITEACLNSVFEKTVGITFEIILVDNASTDGSREVFGKRKDITYLYQQENLGFGRANNVGLEKAMGRNVLFLNSDTLLINNAIKILSDYLDANTKVGGAGGNLYSSTMFPLHSYRRFSPLLFDMDICLSGILGKLLYGKNMEHNHTSTPFYVVSIIGADLMVKKTTLDMVGYFDPRFFMYCEETELCHRIRIGGERLVSVPDAKIIHLEGASFTSENKLIRRVVMNRESTRLYCSLHYSKIYSAMVEFVWRITIWSRILWYAVKHSPKKFFWMAIKAQSLDKS